MVTIEEAKTILKALGLPAKQQGDLAALTFLALAGLKPRMSWSTTKPQLLRINDMLNAMKEWRGKRYAENTRETVRKDVLYYFVQARVVNKNPHDPSLPTNSPNTRYQLTKEALACILAYGTPNFDKRVRRFLAIHGSLLKKYQKERAERLISVGLPLGKVVDLSPGQHNLVSREAIEKFLPAFAKKAKVIYVGDTADKNRFVDEGALKQLGLALSDHGKLPDIIFWEKKNQWLYLIEVVTTRGPVTPQREQELRDLFGPTGYGLIFVSVFPDRATFKKHASDIAWETEVWLADEPTHLIHYNGEKFLGPYAEGDY